MNRLNFGKSILDVFPVEITILITGHMTRSTRENFSRCSVLCYQLCFPLRFKPKIILTPDSISLFQNGGLCEPVRRSIRSIRFQSPYFLDPKIGQRHHIVNFADFPDHSFENFITQLRIYTVFLGLFPNIHELYIYYYVPLACELNVYAAILRSICTAGHPVGDTLQRLEIRFHKNSAPNIDGPFASILRGLVAAIWWLFSWNKSTAAPAPVSYQDLYRALSSENRRFLGKDIKDENGLKRLASKLSSLRTATISAHRSATSLDDDSVGIFERSRFYAASLATAPKLDTLYVRSEVLREFQDKLEACQMDQLDERFSTKSYGGLSLIEHLSIIYARPGLPEHKIVKLFDGRPGHHSLHYVDIDCDILQSSHNRSGSDRYDKANNLTFAKLGRSISPQQLKILMEGLGGIGLDHSLTVEFEGVRCRDKVWEGRPQLVRTFFSVKGTGKGGELKVKSATAPATYVGSRNRYTDPDYIENPAAYVCRVVIIYGLIVVLSKVVSIRLETYFMV